MNAAVMKLDAQPGVPLVLDDERLDLLATYLPDLVAEYRKAADHSGE